MNTGYLIFAALMMAAWTASRTRSTRARPATKDLYDHRPEEGKNIPTVPFAGPGAGGLDGPRNSSKAGGVF